MSPRTRLKQLWKDPVGSAVIASAITAAVSAAFASLYSSNISFCVGPAFAVVAATFFAYALITIFWAIRNKHIESSGKRHYVKDSFLGFRWRWTYDESGKVKWLVSYCPSCDRPMSNGENPRPDALRSSYFSCHHCRTYTSFPHQLRRDITGKVEYLIGHNLSDGTWRERLDN